MPPPSRPIAERIFEEQEYLLSNRKLPIPPLNISEDNEPPNHYEDIEDIDYDTIPEPRNDSVEPSEPLSERPLLSVRVKLNETEGNTIHNRRSYNSNEYSEEPKPVHHYSNST